MSKTSTTDIHPALAAFDQLPDIARVPIPVVAGLFGVSEMTVWRRVKSGLLPKPRKECGTVRWVVGELRQALAN